MPTRQLRLQAVALAPAAAPYMRVLRLRRRGRPSRLQLRKATPNLKVLVIPAIFLPPLFVLLSHMCLPALFANEASAVHYLLDLPSHRPLAHCSHAWDLRF